MSKKHAPAGGAQSVPSASLCKRRTAKRESARRIRARNKDLLSSLCDESKQLGTSNEGLTQELVLANAELSELQQQISATRAQTLYLRSRGDQLSQEVSMLLRMSAGLMYQTQKLNSTMSHEPITSPNR